MLFSQLHTNSKHKLSACVIFPTRKNIKAKKRRRSKNEAETTTSETKKRSAAHNEAGD
jgi:hypothetical protein